MPWYVVCTGLSRLGEYQQLLCGGKQTTVQAATSGSNRLEVFFFFTASIYFLVMGLLQTFMSLGDPHFPCTVVCLALNLMLFGDWDWIDHIHPSKYSICRFMIGS